MRTMYLRVTDECNLRCPFCYISHKQGIMSIETAMKAIKRHEPEEIIFHGGEPMLYPKFVLDIIQQTPHAYHSITTNMTLPWTEERIGVLKSCGIATSYSVDRFADAKIEAKFMENVRFANSVKDVTLLVTLSKPQLSMPPEMLAEKVEEIGCRYVLFERLYGGDDVAAATDDYLLALMKLVPPEKNVLRLQMEDAIKTGANVFSINCEKNIVTVHPDGHEQSCPNGACLKRKRRLECLMCELYQYCRGDCLSFQDKCHFPKEAFSYVQMNPAARRKRAAFIIEI